MNTETTKTITNKITVTTSVKTTVIRSCERTDLLSYIDAIERNSLRTVTEE